MTNFLLSSAICFDSAKTGFKAAKKVKVNCIGNRKDEVRSVCVWGKTSRIRLSCWFIVTGEGDSFL